MYAHPVCYQDASAHKTVNHCDADTLSSGRESAGEAHAAIPHQVLFPFPLGRGP
jgi:hypothetical protein